MLSCLRTMEYAVKNSGWLMLDSVDTLFQSAKERVYNDKNGKLRVYEDTYQKDDFQFFVFHNIHIIYIQN